MWDTTIYLFIYLLKNIFFLEQVSFCVIQTCLKLMIHLPQSPKCWDYRHAPPHWAEEYLYCFKCLAVMNKAALNVCVNINFQLTWVNT
jgi:hypothetical protein